MKFPILTGICQSAFSDTVWNAVYGKVYSAITLVRERVRKPAPALLACVMENNAHEGKLLRTVQSVHVQWKIMISRISEASGISPSVLRRMSMCRVAGAKIATPAYITCRMHRVCPHCYSRWLLQLMGEMSQVLREGYELCALVLVRRPENTVVAAPADIRGLGVAAERVYRKLRRPYRLVRRLQLTKDERWAVTATLVTLAKAGEPLPTTDGVEWVRFAADVRGLETMVRTLFSYTPGLLDREGDVQTLSQVVTLSKSMRSIVSSGPASLSFDNQRVPAIKEIPVLQSFILEEPCRRSSLHQILI